MYSKNIIELRTYTLDKLFVGKSYNYYYYQCKRRKKEDKLLMKCFHDSRDLQRKEKI